MIQPDPTAEKALWSDADRKRAAIMEHAPAVLYMQDRMHRAGIRPTVVMLPAELDPGAYDGPDATDIGAQFLGLPVVWGDRVALLVEA